MNKIISWVAGVGKLWAPIQKFLQGKKTYALGTVTTLQGVLGIWDELAAIDDPASVVGFVRSLSDNPDWKMVLAGIAMFTIKSAIKKAEPKKESGEE